MENKTEGIIKTVLDECKEIQTVLNKDLMKKFGELHNIKSENNIFEMKQEILAKTGYFFNVKKRYILHMVRKEGVPVDEYELRGIYLRRSEYPEITKSKTQELLDILIKKEELNIEEILEFVENTRIEIEELIKNGDKRVSRIASFKNNEEDYKKITSSILGMKLWNILEYEYFISGMKGYQFPILGIDKEKAPERVLKNAHAFNSKTKFIVIPWEEERLPEYYIIDKQAMIDYAWNKRMEELLDPLFTTHEYFNKNKLVTFDFF